MENKKARVLIVDDEPEVVSTLKHFLSAKGYEVIGVLDGREALNILEKEKMDVILLDIMMPGLKGTKAAQIIKEKYPEVKIIIVTGYPSEGEALSKAKLAEEIFIKPIMMQELYNKLSEVINPKEITPSDLKVRAGIKARVILIKARILFVEPSLDTYKILHTHFKGLSNKGEDYVTEVVSHEAEIMEKIEAFHPDILAVNGKIAHKNLPLQETVIYNIEDVMNFNRLELDRLTKAVEVSCLKNGLIEIKWVEI